MDNHKHMNKCDLYPDPNSFTERVRLLIEKARRTNIERDELDRMSGRSAPGDDRPGYPAVMSLLRTAICAIASGLETIDRDRRGSLDCIAEGFCMVQDAELLIRRSSKK